MVTVTRFVVATKLQREHYTQSHVERGFETREAAEAYARGTSCGSFTVREYQESAAVAWDALLARCEAVARQREAGR